MTDQQRGAAPSDPPWVAAADAAPQLDSWELADLDVLTEITHPTRGAVLRRLKVARSVAEVAELMDVPVTRLYHHVNKLAAAGLIQVVATRQVAAVTERRYQTVARSYRVAEEVFDTFEGRELAIALGSIFDLAKIELQRTVEAQGRREQRDLRENSMLTLGQRHLSPAARDELIRRLSEFAEEFESDLTDDDPEAITITLLMAAFPATA